MKSEPDVLIAGAGPTGLTLACGLLANGVAARVVDQAVEPAGTSRALGFQPRGIEVVERLGALNGLPDRALQVEEIVVHINGKHAASVRADLRLSRHSISMWLAGDSVFGAFPLPGQDVWRLMAPATDPGTEAELVTDEAVLAEVTHRLGERTGCDPSLIRDPEWVTSFRVHRRLAEAYRNGRILLAGDAAHVHSLFGGQGMNTGIDDAENLAWKLAMVVNGTAEHDLLDSYEAERRPIAAKLLKSAGAAGNLILGNHVFARKPLRNPLP